MRTIKDITGRSRTTWPSDRRIVGLVVALGLAMALGACATAEPGYYDDGEYVYTDVEPPPPEYEVAPAPPGADYVWIPGHWRWSGHRYVWVPGRYELRPSSTVVWVHAGWIHTGGRYRYVPGRWARRGHAPHYRYVHPPARRYRARPARPVHRPAPVRRAPPPRHRRGDRPPPRRRPPPR